MFKIGIETNPFTTCPGINRGKKILEHGLGADLQDTWIALYFMGTITKLQVYIWTLSFRTEQKTSLYHVTVLGQFIIVSKK